MYCETSAAVGEQAFKAEMISVIRSREDPEEIHAVQVICAKQIEYAVIVYSIRAELEPAPLITCIHDNCEEGPGAVSTLAVAGDLHSDHRACEDHVDRFRDIDELSHADLAQDRFEKGTVSTLADCRVKSDPGTDVEQPYIVRFAGKFRGVRGDMIRGLPGNGLMRERIEDRGPVVVSDPADVAGADCLPLMMDATSSSRFFFIPSPLTRSFPDPVWMNPTSCILKIADPVDDGVHCPVSSQYDEAAFFTAEVSSSQISSIEF